MALTKRRREFLDQIYRQYKEKNLPVHYSDVAEAIGVSKWTAYDMLNSLENQGFLTRTYTNNENELGRSVVVFTPTENAEKIFQKERREISNKEEWDKIVKEVTTLIEKQQKLPLSEAMYNILTLIQKVEVKIEFSLYFLAILILYLNSLGKNVKMLTVNTMNASKEPKIRLTVFVGSVVGMIIQSASDEISPDMVKFVQQFFDYTNKLHEEELKRLIIFIEQS